MMIDFLKLDLIRDEGLRLKPYKDSEGILTIGVGRNLEARGISDEEAGVLLRNDIAIAVADLDRNAVWWRTLSDNRQRGLANMCFNLGWSRLSGFKNMLESLKNGDFDAAAREALQSKWARQVGARAERIATLFREG